MRVPSKLVSVKCVGVRSTDTRGPDVETVLL